MGEGEDLSTVSTIWDDFVDILGDGFSAGVTRYIDNEQGTPPASPVYVPPPAAVVNRTNTIIVLAVIGGLALLYFTRAK